MGICHRVGPCGLLTCYKCPFVNESAYELQKHVQKEHNNGDSISIQTDVKLSSVKVKRELIEDTLQAPSTSTSSATSFSHVVKNVPLPVPVSPFPPLSFYSNLPLDNSNNNPPLPSPPPPPLQDSQPSKRLPLRPFDFNCPLPSSSSVQANQTPPLASPIKLGLTTPVGDFYQSTFDTNVDQFEQQIPPLPGPTSPFPFLTTPSSPTPLLVENKPDRLSSPLKADADPVIDDMEGNKIPNHRKDHRRKGICNECGPIGVSLKYHIRRVHQPHVSLNLTAGDESKKIAQDPTTRTFTCPICNEYSNVDPAPLLVRRFLFLISYLRASKTNYKKKYRQEHAKGCYALKTWEDANTTRAKAATAPPHGSESNRTNFAYVLVPPLPSSYVLPPGTTGTRRRTRVPKFTPAPIKQQRLLQWPRNPRGLRGRPAKNMDWLEVEYADPVPEEDVVGSSGVDQETDPAIISLLSDLNLRLVFLPSQPKYRLIVCVTCQKGLEPRDAVKHSTSTTGEHKIKMVIGRRKELRAWIESATDLCSSNKPPPRPDPNSPPVPFIKLHPGFKCSKCDFCSTSQSRMERHFREKPGQAHVAKRATLQHLFGNRALFPVQPNRHNDGKGNSNGIDLYALYANMYKLDAEEESAASIPFYQEEKEMPMMLQITRWFEHVWPYLREGDDEGRTDEDDGSSDDEDVGMDEGILGTGKRIRSQKAGLSLPSQPDSQARKRRKMKHKGQAAPSSSNVEMSDVGELGGLSDLDSDADWSAEPDNEVLENFDEEDDKDDQIQGTKKRHRSQKGGWLLPPEARKRRKTKHKSQATLLSDVEMSDLGDLDNDIDSDDANEDDDGDGNFSSGDEDEDEMDVDEEDDDGGLLDEEFLETRRRSRIGKRARRRWEKWDTLTSIHKAEILVSVVAPVSTKEQKMRWYGTKLRDAIYYWMQHVAKNVQKSGLRIRQVLGG